MKQNNKKQSLESGFTLIELLIVIAVMAILTTVVFVALNPLARFQDSRNSRRWSDVNAILGAVKLHQVDNRGAYLDSITAAATGTDFIISTQGAALGTAVSCNGASLTATVNLSDLVSKGYLPKLPFDPNNVAVIQDEAAKTVTNSMYFLRVEGNNAITVGACGSEKGSETAEPKIEVVR